MFLVLPSPIQRLLYLFMLFLFILTIWSWRVWGRKDPMLPGNGLGDTDKTCFTTDTQYAFQHTGLNTSDIKEYIRNPHKFNTKWEMDGKYYNLWSTDNERTDANDEVVIKSVYDPSPVGYSLPASNAFTGFTITGQNVGSWPNPLTPEQLAQLNVKGDFDKGWYFYTKPNKQGNIIFFVACNYRTLEGLGVLTNVTNFGWYWSTGAISNIASRILGFGREGIFPFHYDYRLYAICVRSAEEK